MIQVSKSSSSILSRLLKVAILIGTNHYGTISKVHLNNMFHTHVWWIPCRHILDDHHETKVASLQKFRNLFWVHNLDTFMFQSLESHFTTNLVEGEEFLPMISWVGPHGNTTLNTLKNIYSSQHLWHRSHSWDYRLPQYVPPCAPQLHAKHVYGKGCWWEIIEKYLDGGPNA